MNPDGQTTKPPNRAMRRATSQRVVSSADVKLELPGTLQPRDLSSRGERRSVIIPRDSSSKEEKKFVGSTDSFSSDPKSSQRNMLRRQSSLNDSIRGKRMSTVASSSNDIDFGVSAESPKSMPQRKSIKFQDMMAKDESGKRGSNYTVQPRRSSLGSTSAASRKGRSFVELGDSDSEEGSLVGEGSDVDDDVSTAFRTLPLFVPSPFEIVLMNAETRSYELTFLQKLFVLITDTTSCLPGMIYGYIMILIILLSVICIIISSMEHYQYAPTTCPSPACDNDPVLCPGYMMCQPQAHAVFNKIDEFIVVFFSIDFGFRLMMIGSMPLRLTGLIDMDWDIQEEHLAIKQNRPTEFEPKMSKWGIYYNFICSFEGAIDLVSVIPFYVLLFTEVSGASTSFVRVCRVFRIFKVIKSYGGIITVFKKTFAQSMDALVIMAMIILVSQILFACIIFTIESGTYTVNADYPDGAYLRTLYGTGISSPSPYDSIPTAMYWAIITLTTVGYGDLYPQTSAGRALAALAAIGGILCIALPVTVIGSNFSKEFEDFQVAQRTLSELKRKRAVLSIKDKLIGLQSLEVFLSEDEDEEIEFEDGQFNLLGELILTYQQRLDLETAFKIFDGDGSGAISYKEMGMAVSALGFRLTKKSLRKLMLKADVDQTGDLSLDKFYDIFLEILRKKFEVSPVDSANKTSPRLSTLSQANKRIAVDISKRSSFSQVQFQGPISSVSSQPQVLSNPIESFYAPLQSTTKEKDTSRNQSIDETSNSAFVDGNFDDSMPLTAENVRSHIGQPFGRRSSAMTSQTSPSVHVSSSFRNHHFHAPKLTLHSCSHAELVDYTNKLLVVNAELANSMHALTTLMKHGPHQV